MKDIAIERFYIRNRDALSYRNRRRMRFPSGVQSTITVIKVEIGITIHHIGCDKSAVYAPQSSLPRQVAIKKPIGSIVLLLKGRLSNPHKAPIGVFQIGFAGIRDIQAGGDMFIIAAETEDIAFPTVLVMNTMQEHEESAYQTFPGSLVIPLVYRHRNDSHTQAE